MKKIATIGLLSLFLVSPSAFAETTVASQAAVGALQDQLKALQAQIETLQKARAEAAQARENLATAKQSVTSTLKLIKQLRQGMTGEDVKLLQTILAADPSIYPEGLITGTFGPATARAVKRFQKNSGLSQVGNVGPQTLQKLNAKLDENPVGKETSDGSERHCAIIPPGHLIAKGWLKKDGNNRPILPPCQTLPSGIAKQLEGAKGHASTSVLYIYDLGTSNVTSSGATVNWKTTKSATSRVWYATSTPVMSAWNPLTVNSGSFVTNHALPLTSLLASTTYYYLAVSTDEQNVTATSSVSHFTTQ